MTAERVLQGLHKVRKSGPSSWSACCPAHDDKSPSLAVRETDDGRVLLHCFGGCSVDSVLGALGLEMSDLFPPKPDAGQGHARERRPWRANDLLRLAAFESTVVSVVSCDIMRGAQVSEADQLRFLEAVSRLGDIAQAVND